MAKYYFTLLALILTLTAFGQGTFIPLGYDEYHYIDRLDIRYSKILPISHTSDKPFRRSYAADVAEKLYVSNLGLSKGDQKRIQYIADDNAEWLDTMKSRTPRPLWKLYREPATFAHVQIKNFNLRINPVGGFRVGGETEDKKIMFWNSRGAEIRGNIKKVVSFYLNVTENQNRLAPYYNDKFLTGQNKYVPGFGYYKDYESKLFKVQAVDYFDARGYVNVNVLDYFNITMGHDKNFIGNGYRSMFLSDYSAPYFFLKLNTKVWRFSYTNIFAQLVQQYGRGADQNLPRKYAAFHHLNYNVTHFLDIGVFEGVIMNRNKGNFEVQYLNPLIFYRSIEQYIGSPDNAVVGFDAKANIVGRMQIYTQFLLDEFNFKNAIKRNGWWANKYSWQLGFKAIDIVKNLDAQLEFNMARPFIYTHNETTNYTNYNQPLAHPLGASFYEFIVIGRYQPIQQVSIQVKYFFQKYGGDSTLAATNLASHYGSNILLPTSAETVTQEYNNKIAQGNTVNQSIFNLMVTYMPWHNVFLDLEMTYRKSDAVIKASDSNVFYVMFGARMNIPYRFYDF
jgi:hypothetical protein